MRQDIHPKYQEVTVTCGCGDSFVTRSTATKLGVEICSKCHPFYTGKQKMVDAAGRVEKFQRRYGWNKDTVAAASGEKSEAVAKEAAEKTEA